MLRIGLAEVRSIIRSSGQLSELRASVRRDVAASGDHDLVIDDFVMAVNEVVSAALSHSMYDTVSLDVRWLRRTQPFVELYAEIRNTAGTPNALLHDGIVLRVLHHVAERVDVQELIGGSMITVRSRM